MDRIQEFILSVCAVSAASSLIDGALPSGSVKKYVSYLVSLVVLVTVLSPVGSIASAVTELASELPEGSAVAVMARANGVIAMRVERAVCDKFSLDPADVSCDTADGVMTLRVRKCFGIFADDLRAFVWNGYGIWTEVELYE